MEKKPIKSIEDFLKEDLPILRRSFAGRRLAGNQLRSLDSLWANMEEGYERKSGKEIKNFFRMSKDSAGEARGRYKESITSGNNKQACNNLERN